MDKWDFSAKRVALFGLGAQERYPEHFASLLMRLYEVFKGDVVGGVIDQRTQSMHTDERINGWVELVKLLLLEKAGVAD